MLFRVDDFKRLFSKELPGQAAHDKVMSYVRPSIEEVLSREVKARLSAVVFLLYPKKDEWYFLLLKRHDYQGVHSGQVGLPGGSLDEGETMEEAALRELQEETGLIIEGHQIICQLSALYIPPSNFIVHPFVALVEQEPPWKFDEREVKRGIEVPLSELMRMDNLNMDSVQISGENTRRRVNGFPFGGEVVWGATAMILSECKEILMNLGE